MLDNDNIISDDKTDAPIEMQALSFSAVFVLMFVMAMCMASHLRVGQSSGRVGR